MHTLKSAQSKLISLLGKIRRLHGILSTLQLQLETARSSTIQHLHEPLSICEKLLTRLKTRLDNFKIIAGCVVGPLLDKDGLIDMKRLDDLIPILQLALDADNLTITQGIENYLRSFRLENLEQTHTLHHQIKAYHQDARIWKEEEDEHKQSAAESQLRRSIFTWLASVDIEVNYLSACQRNQPGTGKWLLESKTFLNWKSCQSKHLWLNAKGLCHHYHSSILVK